MNRAALVAVLLACLLNSICLAGEARPQVVLLSLGDCCPEVSWPEAEMAVVDELKVVGFPVQVVQSTGFTKDNRQDEMRRIAEEHGVNCVFRIFREPGSPGDNVEIWTRQPEGRKSSFLLIHTEESPNTEGAQVLALRTVELLRSKIGEFDTDKTTSVRDVSQPDAVTEIGEKPGRFRPISASLGAVMTTSPGRIGLLGSLQLAVRWHPFEELSLEFDGAYSVFGQKLHYDRASATFDLASIRAWMLYAPGGEKSIRPCLGIGTGLVLAWSQGNASGDYVSRRDLLAAGYLGITGQIAILPLPFFRIRILVRYGYALPEMTVRFGSDEIAHFGKPIIESGMSLEYHF